MKHLNRRLLFACIALFSPLPLSAQDYSQCPAPVVEGEWTIDQSTATLVEAFSPQGMFVMTAPPPKDTQFGTVIIDGCSSTFTFETTSPDGTPLAWELTPENWTGKNGPVYTSSISPMPGMTFNSKWTIVDPYKAVGVLEIMLKNGDTMATGSPTALLQSVRSPVARARYECRCKDQLQSWIDGRIAEATEMRDAFANPKYYEHPDGIPPNKSENDDNWRVSVYETVIYAMVGRGISHSQAVKVAANTYYPDENSAPTTSDGSAPSVIDDTGMEDAATTDMDNCKTEFTESDKTECFPALAHEATDIHEDVHRKTCWSRTFEPALTVAQVGQEEANGYQAEIDFLESFIEENCQ